MRISKIDARFERIKSDLKRTRQLLRWRWRLEAVEREGLLCRLPMAHNIDRWASIFWRISIIQWLPRWRSHPHPHSAATHPHIIRISTLRCCVLDVLAKSRQQRYCARLTKKGYACDVETIHSYPYIILVLVLIVAVVVFLYPFWRENFFRIIVISKLMKRH